MFELTNEQRKCFALPPVLDTWEKVEVPPNPCDMYYMYAYLDGTEIKKVIRVFDEQLGHETYCEYDVDAKLSEDRSMLLPKTVKGMPTKFNTVNLNKRTPTGMMLNFLRGSVSLVNCDAQVSFYDSSMDDVNVETMEDFSRWIDNWCRESGSHEIEMVSAFASQPRIHQKYREGDFFRFRINRKLYGYGRILIDFGQMRKKKLPFWDIFMGKPLCVAVYHIAAERNDLRPEQLKNLPTLPAQMIMDNIFYYGECPIIGNLPVEENKFDYPIHYGKTIRFGETGARYQCGKIFQSLENGDVIASGFRNGSIGFDLHVKLPILQKCIEAKSNQPYWDLYYPYAVNQDLRNPKFSEVLKRIKMQMGVV